MPDFSKKIVYLSQAQYQELITNESITVDGVTVTYNDNDIYVTPQAEPITDVKINGTSIGNNGVANIPLMTDSIYGIAKINGSYGITMSNGALIINKSPDATVKLGTDTTRPIVPVNQHLATFYGLSKVAGVDLASETITLGTYPDTSKAAIQNMLGITDLISTEESSPATAAHALNSTFMMNGKLHRATVAIAVGDAVEVGTNCEVVKADEVFVKKTDYANSDNYGIVKIGKGLQLNSTTQKLEIKTAGSSVVKQGSSSESIITPERAYEATFYGLSKAAGINLANKEVTLGTYPETSKTAIRTLIGAGTPLDVQVNGTSIVNSGVANIPIANETNLGLVIVDGHGLQMRTESGKTMLSTFPASTSYIKSGLNVWGPIVPSTQHYSVFYGLATAAGDSTQSASSNTVGTYTDAAKTAIRTMLGATSSNVIAVQDEQPTNADTKVWLPETEAQGIQVPTYEEFQALDSSVVKKTDYATSSNAGIVKITGNGLAMSSSGDGTLIVSAATSGTVKSGVNAYYPITPAHQHEAVFYGLAKAAGDTSQASSDNAVGTYTTTASAAIRSMLGITQTLTVTVLTQDNVTVTNQTVTLREGGPTGQVYATATYSGQPISFALPTGFSYYVSVSDTLAHHFNPTTASGIITDADAAATLTYSDFSSIQTAADIKAALNAGLDLTDLVGEQISCTWNNSTLVWDVVDYSNDTITLLTHDTLPTQLVFEPVQALMWCENGLAAGSYSFIDGSSTYYFTLTTAIPSGGQLRATTSAFQTYASMEATATLETGTVSTTEISGATSLGTTASGNLNHMSRVNYGSNNYKESGLFQWLNSTEAANTPMPRITKFSRPCTYNVPGFLGALDSSFVAAIDDTTWLCSTNNTYECPTSLGGTVAKSNAYTVTAKVGLASEMEIFGSYGGTADGSAIFDLFNGATADDRKKYQPGTSTARYWWLRSPYWSLAYYVRYVYSSGAANYYSACISSGVVPAVKISKTVVSE